jgi:hypothetical protein
MLSVMKLNKENDKLKNNELIQLTPMNFPMNFFQNFETIL